MGPVPGTARPGATAPSRSVPSPMSEACRVRRPYSLFFFIHTHIHTYTHMYIEAYSSYPRSGPFRLIFTPAYVDAYVTDHPLRTTLLHIP
ncbi:hypothetical protein HanPSC8_Chr11g0499811 [Helianthus annuus]|nr:hypothetical protein HanPSC8_Chr11g0499811 [Helianthus annuus]